MRAQYGTHCSSVAARARPASSASPTGPSTPAGSIGKRKPRLLDEKRADYKPHVFVGNMWLTAAQHLRQGATEPQAAFTEHLGSHHLIERGSNLFPVWLRDDLPAEGLQAGGVGADGDGPRRRPNLSLSAQRYLDNLGMDVEDLFHHVIAVLHDPAYREANAGALRMEWPRIPLPGWPDLAAPAGQGARSGRGASRSAQFPGGEGGSRTAPTSDHAEQAAQTLAASAARGRELARLLDSDTPVPGVTEGALRPEIAAIAVPATVDRRNMAGEDFALTAGWGHFGSGRAVMPGQGRIEQRVYTRAEREALNAAVPLRHSGARQNPGPRREPESPTGFRIKSGMTDEGAAVGDSTFDVYLNDRAYWHNVPAAVWNYKLGGYQVLKKWLSYRERAILGRPLLPEEVQHFTDTARRIAAILLATSNGYWEYEG